MKPGPESGFFTLNQPEMAQLLHLAARQQPEFADWEYVGEMGGWTTIKLARAMRVCEFTNRTKRVRG